MNYMERKNINEIKKNESKPRSIKIFTEQEIKDITDLYNSLPVTLHNKKQNVIKKRWLQNYNKNLDNLYKSKIKEVLGECKMDNLKSDNNEEFLGLFHESFSPLPLHVDSGFDENIIIYKQVITPLIGPGDTVFFKKRWYGKSTTFTIDKDELNFKPKPGQNDRSCEHLGSKEFDKKAHEKYLTHIDINNLKGMDIEMIYEWKVGESLIVDRTHVHCASSRINNKKLGLTTFTKK